MVTYVLTIGALLSLLIFLVTLIITGEVVNGFSKIYLIMAFAALLSAPFSGYQYYGDIALLNFENEDIVVFQIDENALELKRDIIYSSKKAEISHLNFLQKDEKLFKRIIYKGSVDVFEVFIKELQDTGMTEKESRRLNLLFEKALTKYNTSISLAEEIEDEKIAP